jgi:serine/threonine protein phosphatase PrpC
MRKELVVSLGQKSSPGRKEINQDFHGAWIPEQPELGTKGIAIAIADGISTSNVSDHASEIAVTSFLQDYYCTSDSWTVKNAAYKVIKAVNSWLYARTLSGSSRIDREKGYVCTFSALILKSATAYIFHIGDARVYHLRKHALEQLTRDHRIHTTGNTSYLSRALGIEQSIELDYREQHVEEGDIFILATDGIHEFVSDAFITETILSHQDELDEAARIILESAFEAGSEDNLTIQLLHVSQIPDRNLDEVCQQMDDLELPPALYPRTVMDDYDIIRQLNSSSRSHVWFARDRISGKQVVLKVPSNEYRNDQSYLEKFLLEEWITRRVSNPHIVSSFGKGRPRKYLYLANEYIKGQTLDQWLKDNPAPSLEQVRDIVNQIATGVQALHRQEILHQDVRPHNIMIDENGFVTLIDLGSCRVGGLAELDSRIQWQQIQGTALYTAPEYYIGEPASSRSDIYSLGIITYQMITGSFPYGAEVARANARSELNRISYKSVLDKKPDIPLWIDEAIKKATSLEAHNRYDEIAEFIYELRHPNKQYLTKTRPPLIERNPLMFWQLLSCLLALACLLLLAHDLA